MRSILIILLALASSVHAHLVEQIFADFSQTKNTWELKIRFDAGLALPEMRQDKETPQPKRAWLLSRTPEQLAAIKRETEIYLHEYLKPIWTSADEKQKQQLNFITTFPAWESSPPTFTSQFTDTGFAYFDVIIRGKTPDTSGKLLLSIPSGNHPDLAVGFENKHILTAYPGKSLTLINLSHSPPTGSDSFLSFLDYGYRHVIPEGWDHVLFILALVCLTFAWKPLLTQSIVFTIGHTTTLALVVSQTIPTPAPETMKWIEALIAATILYIAVENIVAQKVRPHRLLMVFLFGLIHGLGFASVLGTKIRAAGDITMPLIAANLGVELGQVTVIAATLILLWWARNKDYLPIILKTISAATALTATFWIIERIAT